MRGYLPNSGTTDSCEKDCALDIVAELLNGLMSLGCRHLSVQTLKFDVTGIQGLTDEVEHLRPVREDDARTRSAMNKENGSKIDHLLIGRLVESSLYDCKFFISAATFDEGL